MKIKARIVLAAMASWREQIAEAMEAADPKPVLRHLDAAMSQAEEIMRQRSSPDDDID